MRLSKQVACGHRGAFCDANAYEYFYDANKAFLKVRPGQFVPLSFLLFPCRLLYANNCDVQASITVALSRSITTAPLDEVSSLIRLEQQQI